jgi:hypothetical protein
MAKKNTYSEEEQTFILGKLMEYKQQGIRKRDEGSGDREKARDVWNGQFTGSPPADSLYFPKVYSLLRHWVRSIRKVYARPEHVVQVHAEGLHASDWEVYVARKQREELLYLLHSWNDMKSFIDDTATQGTIIGSMCAKIRWVREEVDVMEETVNLDFDDAGEIVENKELKVAGKKVVHNYPRLEWMDREKFLYEDGRSIWADVRWGMQIEIEATESEYYALAQEGLFDEALVKKFFNDKRSASKAVGGAETPEETTKYKYLEFWGWMQTKEDGDVKFVRIYATEEADYLLSYPEEHVYRHLTSKPMLPFEMHYLIKREGEIEGDSPCLKARHLQGEINCIRNQRRRSIENDLNYKFILDRNADVQFTKLGEGAPGMVIESNGLDGVTELNSKDNTASSYGELEFAQKDLEELTGVNPLVLGMPDPHLADTAFGINLMSNNANTNIFDVVESYNTFFERCLTKMLELSIQYTDIEQLEETGILLEDLDVTREDMQKPLRIRIDAGIGATSEMVEINNKTKAYFMSQQLAKNLMEMGVEIGPLRYMPSEIYRDILPLLGIKNVERYIPTPKEFEQWTKKTLDMKMEMMKRQQAVGMQGARTQRGAEAQKGFNDGQAEAAKQAQAQQGS